MSLLTVWKREGKFDVWRELRWEVDISKAQLTATQTKCSLFTVPLTSSTVCWAVLVKLAQFLFLIKFSHFIFQSQREKVSSVRQCWGCQLNWVSCWNAFGGRVGGSSCLMTRHGFPTATTFAGMSFTHHTACTDHTVVTDRYSSHNHYSTTDPNIVADANGFSIL